MLRFSFSNTDKIMFVMTTIYKRKRYKRYVKKIYKPKTLFIITIIKIEK